MSVLQNVLRYGRKHSLMKLIMKTFPDVKSMSCVTSISHSLSSSQVISMRYVTCFSSIICCFLSLPALGPVHWRFRRQFYPATVFSFVSWWSKTASEPWSRFRAKKSERKKTNRKTWKWWKTKTKVVSQTNCRSPTGRQPAAHGVSFSFRLFTHSGHFIRYTYTIQCNPVKQFCHIICLYNVYNVQFCFVDFVVIQATALKKWSQC